MAAGGIMAEVVLGFGTTQDKRRTFWQAQRNKSRWQYDEHDDDDDDDDDDDHDDDHDHDHDHYYRFFFAVIIIIIHISTHRIHVGYSPLDPSWVRSNDSTKTYKNIHFGIFTYIDPIRINYIKRRFPYTSPKPMDVKPVAVKDGSKFVKNDFAQQLFAKPGAVLRYS